MSTLGLLVPAFLTVGLFALAIVLLHMRRRRSRTVPSVLIWQQIAAAASSANPRLQWPRPSLLLALQVATILLLALALAQPILGGSPAREHWIVIVDRTVTGAEAQRRLEAGIEAARDLVARRGPDIAQLTVLSVGAGSEYVFARRVFETALTRQLGDGMQPVPGVADWREAARMTLLAMQADTPAHLVIVSDEAPPVGWQQALGTPPTEVVPIEPAIPANTIAGVTLASDPAGDGVLLQGSVAFAGTAPTKLAISFTSAGSGAALPWSNWTVTPRADGTATPFRVPLDLPGPGTVAVSEAEQPEAGTWTFVVREQAPVLEVLYVGPGEQPLVRALQAIEGVKVFAAAEMPEDASRFGLAVIDKVAVPTAPGTNTIWIGDARLIEEPEAEAGGPRLPTAWDDEHALSRGIAWSQMGAIEAAVLAPRPDEETVLGSGAVPLILAASPPAGRQVRLAFDPATAAWSGQTGFPRLVLNIVEWLGPLPGGDRVDAPCTAGAACRFDGRLIGGTARLTDDAEVGIALSSSGEFVPERSGLYELVRGTLRQLVAVNPPAQPATVPPAATSEADGTAYPLWSWLAGVAGLLLLLEAGLAGRGSERFLHRTGLSGANPLARRRRAILGLRIATVLFVAAAIIDLPIWAPLGQEQLVLVSSGDGAAASDATKAAASYGMPAQIAADSPAHPVDASLADLLRLADALVDPRTGGQIVLAGAPAANEAQVASTAESLAGRGLRVSLAIEPDTDDIAVTRLSTPDPIFAGDSFALSAYVEADRAGAAVLSTFRNGELIAEQEVQLEQGTSRVETLVADLGEAPQLFEMAIARPGLAPSDNDRNGLWVTPRPAGQLAVIARDAFEGAFFARMLRSQGLDVVSMVPDRAPFTLDGWLRFDGIVLLDVPAIALNTAQHRQIETAVNEHGRTLLLTGGPNSFGPGGYLQTALERLSPLSSNIPRETPKVAMVFVLDRSGSMQQPVGRLTRLDIAKQAADAAIHLLNPQSEVAIIVFDEAQQLVLPLQEIGDGAAVEAAIGRIDAGGGTSIYPGLVEAAVQLEAAQTQVKHVIVMTDGLSQPGDFPGAIGRLRGLGATVSSVAIGEGAGANLVETIANLGEGTFHATQDFEALPSILAQEALLLSEDAVELGTSSPQWVDRSASYLRHLPETMPDIGGFVLTTAKPAASVLLATADKAGEPMPLMATWRHGNGQVTALATQAIGDWTGSWQELETYPAAWAQLIRQFLPPTEEDGLRIAATRVGDSVDIRVRLDNRADAAAAPPTLTVRGAPDSEPINLAVSPGTAPGEYRARYTGTVPGDYRFEASADGIVAATAIHIAYPQVRDPARSRSGHAYLVSRTGGEVLTEGKRLPQLAAGLWIEMAGWPVYLLSAVALFMADLSLRYSGLVQRVLAPRGGIPDPPRPARPAERAAAPPTLELSQ